MTSEEGANGDVEEPSGGDSMPAMPNTMTEVQPTDAGAGTMEAPKPEGKRTQLKIVRENLEYLASDVGKFRKSHESSVKRLEAQVASLRKEFAEHANAKDLVLHAKSTEASNKRLEKQVATLRNELAAMKASVARDAARGRAREEATLARILAKVSAKAKAVPKPAKPKAIKKK